MNKKATANPLGFIIGLLKNKFVLFVLVFLILAFSFGWFETGFLKHYYPVANTHLGEYTDPNTGDPTGVYYPRQIQTFSFEGNDAIVETAWFGAVDKSEPLYFKNDEIFTETYVNQHPEIRPMDGYVGFCGTGSSWENQASYNGKLIMTTQINTPSESGGCINDMNATIYVPETGIFHGLCNIHGYCAGGGECESGVQISVIPDGTKSYSWGTLTGEPNRTKRIEFEIQIDEAPQTLEILMFSGTREERANLGASLELEFEPLEPEQFPEPEPPRPPEPQGGQPSPPSGGQPSIPEGEEENFIEALWNWFVDLINNILRLFGIENE